MFKNRTTMYNVIIKNAPVVEPSSLRQTGTHRVVYKVLIILQHPKILTLFSICEIAKIFGYSLFHLQLNFLILFIDD